MGVAPMRDLEPRPSLLSQTLRSAGLAVALSASGAVVGAGVVAFMAGGPTVRVLAVAAIVAGALGAMWSFPRWAQPEPSDTVRAREWSNLWGFAPHRTVLEFTRPVVACGAVIGVMLMLGAVFSGSPTMVTLTTVVTLAAGVVAVICLRPLAPALREHRRAERSLRGPNERRRGVGE